MGLAGEIARRVSALNYDNVPPEAHRWSRIAVMDTLGCMLAGTLEDSTRLVRESCGAEFEQGPCRVFGTTRKIGPLNAALINGTAAHALDFDNGSNTMGGHVSATMVPAMLAAAELFGASGRDLLLGHSAGFEVGTHIGRAVNFAHYEKGWHPTSTLGTFAVIGALAAMLKLPPEQTETALGTGASMAAGIKANFGTMTKPLHVGLCAKNGLLAVMLARKGYDASATAFEHKHGFFNVYNGPGTYDAAKVLPDWAAPLEIISPGAGYKQYPCCAATHAALDATLELIRKHGSFRPAQIAKVETWTPARRLAHTDRPEPISNLDAKFSVQYCVTRMLLEGRILLQHFEADAYRHLVTREVMKRVTSVTHRAGQFPVDNHFGAEVKVTLTDGASHSARVDIQLGRTSDNPVPEPLLRAKFHHCAGRVLDGKQVDRLTTLVDGLPELTSVAELTAAATPG